MSQGIDIPEQDIVTDDVRVGVERLSDRESFGILSGYIHGRMPLAERKDFERKIVQAGSLEAVLSPTCAKMYAFVLRYRLSDLESMVRAFFLGFLGGDVPLSALTLFLLEEDHTTSMRRLCVAARDASLVADESTGGLSRVFGSRDRRVRERASAHIRALAPKVAEFLPDCDLVSFFDANYESLPVADNHTLYDIRVSKGLEHVTASGLDEHLSHMSAFALARVVTGFLHLLYVNNFLADRRDGILKSVLDRLQDPFEYALVERAIIGYDGFVAPPIVEGFYNRARSHVQSPAGFWRFFTFFSDRDDVPPDSRLKNFVCNEVAVTHPEWFAEGFMNESNIVIAQSAFRRAPERCRAAVMGHTDDLLTPSNRFKAAFMLRVAFSDFSLRLRTYVSRDDRLTPTIGEIFTLAGMDAEFKTFSLDIESEIQEGRRRARANRDLRRSGVHDRVRGVLDGVAGTGRKYDVKRIDRDTYVASIRDGISSLGIDNVDARMATLRSFRGRVRNEVGEWLTVLGEVWPDPSRVRSIDCEPDSLLGRMGIVQLHFRCTASRTASFAVEFEFEDGRFDPEAHIEDTGDFSVRHLPPGMPWSGELIEADVMRLFLRLLTDEEQVGLDCTTLLQLLGLREFDMTVPQTNVPPVSPADAVPSPDAEEKAREAVTDLLRENVGLFQQFISAVRGDTSVSVLPFSSLLRMLTRLQAAIEVRHSIRPGGVPFEIDPHHPLAGYVRGVELFNVPQSRAILHALGVPLDELLLFPDMIPKSADDVDMYVAVVTLCIDGLERNLYACIAPPPYCDVHVLGIKNNDLRDDRAGEAYMLMHLIVHAFHSAVGRGYTVCTQTVRNDQNPSDGPQARNLKRIIRDVTHADLPIVVEALSDSADAPADAGGGDIDGGGSDPDSSDASDLSRVFESMWVASDSPDAFARALTGHGLCMRAEDYLRHVGSPNDFIGPDGKPLTCCWEPGRGAHTLRADFANIDFPLSRKRVLQLMETLLRGRLFKTENLGVTRNGSGREAISDPAAWFAERVRGGSAPDTVFELLLRSNQMSLNPRAREIFRRSFCGSYGEVFADVLRKSQRENPSIGPEDVFRAFLGLSSVNPCDVFLPTSGPLDYRPPMSFRSDDMPSGLEPAFRPFEDAEGSRDTPRKPDDCVVIIGDTRFRVGEHVWMVQNERQDPMTVAAQLQRPFHRGVSQRRVFREVSIEPRSRAAVLYRFENGQHALRYLPEARDVIDAATLSVRFAAADVLRQRSPRVLNAIDDVFDSFERGVFTAFDDLSGWTPSQLRILRKKGVVELETRGSRIVGIRPLKKIVDARVLIYKEEPGYRQRSTAPVPLARMFDWMIEQGATFEEGFPFDLTSWPAQKHFYELLRRV